MGSVQQYSGKSRVRRIISKYALITLGSVIYAIGFQYFMFPNQIVSGGLTGIAMILNRFTNWPVGMMILVMNTPLFLIAWRHFGLDYLIGSLVGTAVSSVCRLHWRCGHCGQDAAAAIPADQFRNDRFDDRRGHCGSLCFRA